MTEPKVPEEIEDFGDLGPPPPTASRATARLWRSAWLSHTPASTLILPAPAALPIRRERGAQRPAAPKPSQPSQPQPTATQSRTSEIAVILAVAAALITAVVFLPMFAE